MGLNHQKRKNPDVVRRKIIEHSIQIICERGLSALTLDTAGMKAGVTKGGVMHHFKNRRELIDAVFAYSLTVVEIIINHFISQEDGEAYGRFTRSYLRSLCSCYRVVEMVWTVLFQLIAVDHNSQEGWKAWLDGQLTRYAETDSTMDLRLLRLAGDGLWMAKVTDTLLPESICFQELIERTHQGTGARIRGS